MARMKFLCDADRCIDCNACVTACKNENEVPWGINRRRVVTINDGKPGERSVFDGLHGIAHDAPCAAVCPVKCIYPTRDGIVAAFEGYVHRLRLLLLRLSVRRAAVPAGRQFGSRGKMDKCTYCAGGGGAEAPGSAEEFEKYGSNRFGEGKLPLCAEMCSNQVVAGGRRRNHRSDLQRTGFEARLWLRRVGLDDGPSRGRRGQGLSERTL